MEQVRKIRIVTDSTADLTQELVDRYQIEVVSLTMFVEGKAYRDKIDLTNEEFYKILRNVETLPTTSQPSPALFAETYQRLAEEGTTDIISIHLASDLSGTFQSAKLASGMVQDKVRVTCLDSRTATMGLGLIVLAAARSLASGKDLEGVLADTQYAIDNNDIYFLLDSLDNLHKGGRIGKASHLVGSLLQIKPVLRLHDGVISPYEKVRGNKEGKALERLIEILIEKNDPNKKTFCTVAYCDNKETAEYMVGKLQEKLNCDEYVYLQIGTVIGTHIGMGAIGLSFYQV